MRETYCRNNNLQDYVFNNTRNNPDLFEICNEPFRSLGKDCGVDRILNKNNEVIFIHLGRGAPKSVGRYRKKGKLSYKDWVKFVKEKILKEELSKEERKITLGDAVNWIKHLVPLLLFVLLVQ